MKTKRIKRVLDVLCASVALVLCAPLLLLAALVVLCNDGRPVLYAQQRVGRGNQLFTIYKIRTMQTNTAPCAQQLTPQSAYIRGGKCLRALSLDELPQLWNIIKGDMSLVGPRPLIPQEEEIRKLRAEAGIYTLVPGLTGWAQINGRAQISDAAKVALDVEYLQRQSLGFDIQILVKTLLRLFKDVG